MVIREVVDLAASIKLRVVDALQLLFMAVARAPTNDLRAVRVVPQLLPHRVAVGEVNELLSPDVTASRREQDARRLTEYLSRYGRLAIGRGDLISVTLHALLHGVNPRVLAIVPASTD